MKFFEISQISPLVPVLPQGKTGDTSGGKKSKPKKVITKAEEKLLSKNLTERRMRDLSGKISEMARLIQGRTLTLGYDTELLWKWIEY